MSKIPLSFYFILDTHFSIHCSSSFLGSLSSFGAARLARLCELTLPASLHVLEAGDGGGRMSKRSAVSLLFPLALDLATLVDVPLPDAIKLKIEN